MCDPAVQQEWDAGLGSRLKIEVEGLKSETSDLKKALDEKTSEVEKSEAAFRSEVSLPVSGGSAPTLSSGPMIRLIAFTINRTGTVNSGEMSAHGQVCNL